METPPTGAFGAHHDTMTKRPSSSLSGQIPKIRPMTSDEKKRISTSPRGDHQWRYLRRSLMALMSYYSKASYHPVCLQTGDIEM